MGEYCFDVQRKNFERELDEFYCAYPIAATDAEARIAELDAQGSRTVYEQKSIIYQAAAQCCQAKVFRFCPFYYELQTGRARNGLTGAFPSEPGIGGWMKRKNGDFANEFLRWRQPFLDRNVFLYHFPADFSHHCLGYDNILANGIEGIRRRAADKLERPHSDEEKGFLRAVIVACDCVVQIAEKFAVQARIMLEAEEDPQARKNLELIADTANRVPRQKPETFYEALNTLYFMREIVISLEGIGVAIVGHIDRLLEPYYIRDIGNGTLTRKEAKQYMACWLSLTDAKWDVRKNPPLGGTNTATAIGGCDADGKVVYNEITRIVMECYLDYDLMDPKLQARISAGHPDEYFEMLAHMVASKANVLSIFNDDVLIRSFTRFGRDIRDARLYVAGGCQEPVLSNCEVNTRAYMYLNLPNLLLMFLHGTRDPFWRWVDVTPRDWSECTSFEGFYGAFIDTLNDTAKALARIIVGWESQWTKFDPLPLFSSMLADCISNAKDATEGGAKYNYSSISLVSMGTLTDSLYAIRKAVFEDRKLSMEELCRYLEVNFEDAERLRQYLLNCIEKYGQDDENVNALAARLSDDLVKAFSGMEAARGGRFEGSFFSNSAYIDMRETGATPDGRRKGEIMSRGIGSSEQSAVKEISKILNTIGSMDLSWFPGSAVLYLDMPYQPGTTNDKVVEAVIRYFVQKGGNVCDFNVMDPDVLRDAVLHPENHRGLVVRVWGFSAYFTTLNGDLQNEIINRVVKGA